MAWNLVQSAAGNGSATNASPLTVAFGSNTTAGNLIIVVWGMTNTPGVVTVTDTPNDTFSGVTNGKTVGAFTVKETFANNIAGGACTVTIKPDVGSGSQPTHAIIEEWSGNGPATSMYASGQNTGTSTAPSANAGVPAGGLNHAGLLLEAATSSIVAGANTTLGSTTGPNLAATGYGSVANLNFTLGNSQTWLMLASSYTTPETTNQAVSTTTHQTAKLVRQIGKIMAKTTSRSATLSALGQIYKKLRGTASNDTTLSGGASL